MSKGKSKRDFMEIHYRSCIVTIPEIPDKLEEMAAHSSVLAWRIPGTGEPGGCRLWGHTQLDTTEAT